MATFKVRLRCIFAFTSNQYFLWKYLVKHCKTKMRVCGWFICENMKHVKLLDQTITCQNHMSMLPAAIVFLTDPCKISTQIHYETIKFKVLTGLQHD